jgi:diguanylate cyclase (GGDEF)-like protein/PAS domain S-box-containing protein
MSKVACGVYLYVYSSVVTRHSSAPMQPVSLLQQPTDNIFWLTFEQAALGIALVSPDGRFLRANPELCKYLDYTEAELQSRDFQSITHPDDLNADLALVERTLSGAINTYRIEKRYIRQDTRVIWGLLSVSLVRDDNGKPLYFIAMVQDITERKQAQAEFERIRDRYLTICDNVRDLVSVHDMDGDYLFASASCLRILGYTPGELVGTNAFNYFNPDDLKVIKNAYKALGNSNNPGRVTYRIRCKNNQFLWFETYARPIVDTRGKASEYICVSRAVIEEGEKRASLMEDTKIAEEHSKVLEALVLRDDLTSLMNRRAIEELLTAKLGSRRTSTFPFGCLLVDVDRFAHIYDYYGQAISEDVLRRIGQILVETCRLEDFVGRYTGDEFIVVLPNTDASGTIIAGERIIRAVEAAYWPELLPGQRITVSIGGTCITRHASMKLNELVELVESQMRQAKESGRNRIVLNAREIARHITSL